MSMKLTCTLIVLNSVLTNSVLIPKPLPEDAKLNFTQLSFKYGHKAEEHSVYTEDGYILTLFHIPGKRKTPVLLTHGILDSADSFVIRGKRSLAITLADSSYDVWVMNTRGNRYARRHVRLNPDTDKAFWNYSFHENGYYDLPATVDYILRATGESKLQSIAHSQGTTNHFVLSSTRPEYNDKFKIFIALAPVAFLSNLIPPVSTTTELGPVFNQALISARTEELINHNSPAKKLIELLCSQGDISYALCFITSGAFVSGFDTKRFEPGFLSTIIGHYPAAASRKSLLHYIQVALTKRFAFFDYGPKKNLKRYGYVVNPDYNLRGVTMKTAIFVGKNDNLSRELDVEYLRTLLPNVVYYHLMEPKEWNHIDFVWGNDMSKTLFPLIFHLLEKYS